MKNVIRAWKDPVYRAKLTVAEQTELAHPAGVIELTGTALDQVAGGGGHSGKGGSGKGSRSGSGKSGGSRKSGSGKGHSGKH